MSDKLTSEQAIAKINTARAARKAANQAVWDDQRALDLAALSDIEAERGDDNVASVAVSRYQPGLPTLVVVRALTGAELRCFRDQTKGEKADLNRVTELVGSESRLYPDQAAWESLLEAIPGLAMRAGVASIRLAAGLEQLEGKV
jgi:hypothetical protein